MKRAIKLDSTQAWREAAGLVMANRDLLLAIAGVFFLVPGLALALFMPEPPVTKTNDPLLMAKMLEAYYLSTLPFQIPALVMQTIGTLAMLSLLGDRQQPTVGQALQQGLKGGATYIAAHILLAFCFSLLGGIVLVAVSLAGQASAALAAGLLIGGLFFYAYLRCMMTAPVIAIERQRNPVAALRQSWHLTKGHVAALLSFMGMAMLLAAVLIYAGMSIIGVLASLLGGAQAGRLAAALVEALLMAVAGAYLCAMLTAAYRQISGQAAQEPQDGVW